MGSVRGAAENGRMKRGKEEEGRKESKYGKREKRRTRKKLRGSKA